MTTSPSELVEIAELVDGLAELTRVVPGVADLHAGPHGEVVTFLPGRGVGGIRVLDDLVEIHVSVLDERPVHVTAAAVVELVRPLAGRPVLVVVEDLVRTGDLACVNSPTSSKESSS